MLTNFLNKYRPINNIKITNVDNNNILNNFPIYVINLRNDKLRRNYIKHLFLKHKINYNLVIFEKFEYNSIEDLMSAKIHRSKLGCILSHLWCIQDAILNNYERFIVFEDDIIFHKNFNNLFKQIIDSELRIDLLMLGSLDPKLKHNLEHFKNDELVYFPTSNIMGAHANIYSLDFAKQFLNYKLNSSKIIEFDYDYHILMNTHKIGICMPNLVVCELSTTNINHNFSPLTVSGFDRYTTWFQENFTYKDYEYIMLIFIDYIREQINNGSKFNSLEEMLCVFFTVKKHANRNMLYVLDCIINSGYNIKDILEIISNTTKDTF